ncbi:MAG: hypothetical protein HYY52_05700 [Candidatus Melainabacteria bacterium]|nr:hypothetical protein [Candidatus Melainabacteria bacterium]
MKKKQYKVKIENGEIKPLEPLDLSNFKEGIIIFLEEENFEDPEDKALLKELIGCISAEVDYKELTPELIDSVVYKDFFCRFVFNGRYARI